MNKFLPTFWLTYSKKVTSRSFIITTVIMMIAIIAFSNIDKIIDWFDHSEDDIIAVAGPNDVRSQFISSYKATDKHLHLNKVTLEAGKKGVKNEKYKQLIALTETKDRIAAKLYSKEPVDDELQRVQSIVTAMQSNKIAQSLHLSPDELVKITAQSTVDNEVMTSKGKAKEDNALDTGIVYIGIFLIFFITINYGSQAATDIANEKSSRVIEMIVTSISPVTHIMAKITGVIAAALTQLTVIALTILSAVYIFNIDQTIDKLGLNFTANSTRIVIYAVIFMLLGLLINISLSAIVGALTNRVEDIGQAVMPVTFMNLAAFYISIFSLQNPDTMLVKISSFIPFFTPQVMLLRTLSDETGDITIIVGIVICLITIILLLLLAARVYKGSVFSYGKGLVKNFRQALQMK